ncbi:MAG TPA: hypothetical protein VNZ45_18005, partial [Bacteroidia bacterium]|nr:hypothetical protein [Bacteroidia bacterium]
TNKPNLAVTYVPVYNNNNTTNSVTYEYQQATKSSFGYSFGSSIRLALSKRLALYGAADYVHTSPVITYQVQDITHSNNNNPNNNNNSNNGDVYSTPITNQTHYKLSSLNLSLGLAYQFKRKGNKYE